MTQTPHHHPAHILLYCPSDTDAAWLKDYLYPINPSYTYLSSPAQLRSTLQRLASSHHPVVILPATTGRNRVALSDLARSLHWEAAHYPSPLILTAPIGDSTTVVAALRSHIRGYKGTAYISSCSIDPFADAELFRLARLAWVHSTAANTVPIFDTVFPRLSDLPCPEPQAKIIRADLHAPVTHHIGGTEIVTEIPLWSPSALNTLIRSRVHAALHLAQDHGDNGIAAALMADHDHGFAHSHGDEEHGHSHPHPHPHPHTHSHPQPKL